MIDKLNSQGIPMGIGSITKASVYKSLGDSNWLTKLSVCIKQQRETDNKRLFMGVCAIVLFQLFASFK